MVSGAPVCNRPATHDLRPARSPLKCSRIMAQHVSTTEDTLERLQENLRHPAMPKDMFSRDDIDRHTAVSLGRWAASLLVL